MAQEQIAVFRALQLGDLLCAVPALRSLRHGKPGARITLVGLPWARDFVERMPYVDDFIEFPGWHGMPERKPDLAGMSPFLDRVHERHFDLAIQLHGSGTLTNPLLSLFGARRMAGFYLAGRVSPDPETFIPWPEDRPEIRRLLALTEHLGLPDCGEALELPILPREKEEWEALHASLTLGSRGYVCIHPGARLASRRWLPARFAQVADQLAAQGLSVLLTGTAAEAPLLASIRQAMRRPAIDLAGHTSLGTLAALVASARLVVCNDTGMSHVAAAVGTPSVVVSSGADAVRWQPLDTERHRVLWHAVPCRPCAWDDCPTQHECAAGISTGAVVDASLSLLSRSSFHPEGTHHDAE